MNWFRKLSSTRTTIIVVTYHDPARRFQTAIPLYSWNIQCRNIQLWRSWLCALWCVCSSMWLCVVVANLNSNCRVYCWLMWPRVKLLLSRTPHVCTAKLPTEPIQAVLFTLASLTNWKNVKPKRAWWLMHRLTPGLWVCWFYRGTHVMREDAMHLDFHIFSRCWSTVTWHHVKVRTEIYERQQMEQWVRDGQ